jgi:hypothetical protein
MRPGLIADLATAKTHARDFRLLGQLMIKESQNTFGTPQADHQVDVLGSSCGPLRGNAA